MYYSDLWLVVFESMSLVHDQHLPVDGAQYNGVHTDVLIGCQHDMELARGLFLYTHTQGEGYEVVRLGD